MMRPLADRRRFKNPAYWIFAASEDYTARKEENL